LQHKADIGIETGGLAHDINNILTLILAPVQLLRYLIPEDIADFEEIEKNRDLIEKNALFACKICRGYTSYLRNIGEKASAQSLLPLIEPLDMYARQFRGQLDRNISDSLPLVKCKGYQLKRVFLNLFMNACQAIENQKEQKIAIRLWSEHGNVMFSIQDNGPGISEDITPLIFKECFSTRDEGTGLGLFLVKKIVEDHNGSIKLSSNDTNGTLFVLSFPIC
ncbi:MAG: HAMP domain-containing histidine kinase, partial [Desulfobacteraceae bacterium]|nr:HAMP domain-containing histidine kinase [Desulfobacteraceae bacterium]